MYLKPNVVLDSRATQISYFNAKLKVPGSKLNAGEGKKILRKSICFLAFLGSYGYPQEPLKKSPKFINL